MALHDEVLASLTERGLIPSERQHVEFQPLERGFLYRRLRSHFVNNAGRYVFGGAVVVGGLAYALPQTIDLIIYTSIGGGVLGVLGSIARPFDDFFLANPKHWVPRLFRGVHASWSQAYSAIDVHSRRELENLVYAARNADVIRREFPDHDDQLKLGILIGRTADLLSPCGVRGDDRVIRGLTDADVIRMVRNQKLRSEEDTKLMTLLNRRGLADSALAHMLSLHESEATHAIEEALRPSIEALARYVARFEFSLTVTGDHDLLSVCSQMSRGSVRVRTSVGHNCGSYLGLHSEGADFPRLHVSDHVGSGFMTHASRGYGFVGGDAEHEVMDKATGGFAVVKGTTAHSFGRRMNDTDNPAIGICYGGVRQQPKEGEVHNGVIVSLSRHVYFKGIRPKIWRFRDGARDEIKLEADASREEIERVALKQINQYLDDWTAARA